MLIRKHFVIFIFLAGLLVNPASGRAEEIRQALIIGNSYTFYNNLDHLVQRIAESTSEPLHVERAAKPGYTLRQHCDDPDTSTALQRQHWDLVILQEQSVVPALPALREEFMLPAARELFQRATARNAGVMMMTTWGRRDGLTSGSMMHQVVNFKDYDAMQAAIRSGYFYTAGKLGVPLIPVSLAWEITLDRYPEINLYAKDGSHPSINGSYLAALTIYGMVTGRCPRGVSYQPPHMPDDVARKLQNAASQALERSRALRRWRADHPDHVQTQRR